MKPGMFRSLGSRGSISLLIAYKEADNMSQSSEPEQLGYLLKTAQHALRREMDDALRPLGLSVSTYAVLTELHRQPGLTNADLARRAFITPQSMQGLLVALEKAGLIARGSDRDHGRRQPSRLKRSCCLDDSARCVAAVDRPPHVARWIGRCAQSCRTWGLPIRRTRTRRWQLVKRCDGPVRPPRPIVRP